MVCPNCNNNFTASEYTNCPRCGKPWRSFGEDSDYKSDERIAYLDNYWDASIYINQKSAIEDAIAAHPTGVDVGAVMVAGAREYYGGLGGQVTFPQGWSLRGQGKRVTGFHFTGPNDGFKFQSTGGSSGDFWIDGGGVATNPLWLDVAVGREFRDIYVNLVNGDGLTLFGAQNCNFFGVDIARCTGYNVTLKGGAASNRFMGFEYEHGGVGFIRIWHDPADPVTGSNAWQNHHNNWQSGICEYNDSQVPGGPTNASRIVYLQSGEATFTNVQFTSPFATGDSFKGLFELAPGTDTSGFYRLLKLNNCDLIQNTPTDSAAGVLGDATAFGTVQVTNCVFLNLKAAFRYGNLSVRFTGAASTSFNNVTNRVENLAGVATNDLGLVDETAVPKQFTRPTVTNTAWSHLVTGESGYRAQLRGTGLYLSRDANSFTPDTAYAAINGGTGNPEGLEFQNKGSLYLRKGIGVYAKNAGSDPASTGWVRIDDLRNTTTWDPPSVATGTFTSTTITVTGATVGRPVSVGFSTVVPAGVIFGGQVTAADTVTVTLANHSGGAVDLASGTLTVRVQD